MVALQLVCNKHKAATVQMQAIFKTAKYYNNEMKSAFLSVYQCTSSIYNLSVVHVNGVWSINIKVCCFLGVRIFPPLPINNIKPNKLNV